MVNAKMQKILDREYQTFQGDTYRNLMPKLIETGLTPTSVSDIMRARLEAFNSTDPEQKDFWLDNYFDTIDGVAYYAGKIKIELNAQPLKDIKPKTELSLGALILTPEEYAKLDREEFSRDTLEKAGLNRQLKKSEVKSHPIWQALAQDNHVLSEYADAIFTEIKKRYGDERAMGVWLGSEQKIPTLRAWFVDSLYGRSSAYGYYDLYLYGNARLVGVRAEGAAQKETLDEKVVEAIRAEQAFEFRGRLYVPVSRKAKVKLE